MRLLETHGYASRETRTAVFFTARRAEKLQQLSILLQRADQQGVRISAATEAARKDERRFRVPLRWGRLRRLGKLAYA